MVCRVLDGIKVTPETLSFDQIKEVGPGGNFLSLDHTLAHIRSEHYIPRLFDRDTYEAWFSNGALDVREKARNQARDILTTHEVEPLAPEVKAELNAIINAAEDSYGR